MSAWWASIEWSDKYDSRYDGVGRYCMYNAWRLDHALELAEEEDLFIELTLNSHGQLRRDRFDAEWEYNPYSAANGGPVATPSLFFLSPSAKDLFRQRYRYIAARCPHRNTQIPRRQRRSVIYTVSNYCYCMPLTPDLFDYSQFVLRQTVSLIIRAR